MLPRWPALHGLVKTPASLNGNIPCSPSITFLSSAQVPGSRRICADTYHISESENQFYFHLNNLYEKGIFIGLSIRAAERIDRICKRRK